ncbi:hypothetical protein [Methylobacterium oryzisoli]|uniref:hypothetical protein n=1 Tax=Methylobacterium oryzisoli TaxID=3385502 RepID=UPI003891D875
MMRAEFIPGFVTAAQARAAGRRFHAKANGMRGIEGRDFHLVQNEHGRWHFMPGKGPKMSEHPSPVIGKAEAP